ncbi:anaerobic dehydrogenase, typically selenocysteine-containing [Desulfitobacterium dehalogenans ATCC 51507]|uniref:Anaerobic dehydrogenase, typically selenocysteine-containing n=1 Tax=Desulfitobacterium dehalogenans (strain ATCC 51507 / DSM 9161 / JW/IU-DC1) TaxID=756499 RepID=I4A4T4_DESDJ|nr:molybdopterin-dependent oxidoreductase [Desulfitobacterium dehalogenans]AFL98968.1 anaerobic dehydrogenase, typically selenocysteine-containing [Desulfitobacterium dehalogenans ATCC 51507]
MDTLHHHICPRNCYDTCSIISTTRNGRLVSIEGNPSQGYTRGKLCPKVMDETHKVYSPHRVKYPMRQRKRFSGQWERISWNEALDIISRQIVSIKEKYRTTLPIAHNKYSGNFGIMHNALEAFMTGLGPTTRAVGSPCWSAGVEAQVFDFGAFFCSDPLDMEKAKLIWIWGANPAWNAAHQMPIIFRAMDHGAKVICLDTHFSATAARVHQFVRVNPGTDGLLALGLAKIIVDHQLTDPELPNYSLGHEEFMDYLKLKVDLQECSEVTGVSIDTMKELALEYGATKPACIWAGFGLQRYTNGGQNLRAIDALGALTGNIGRPGGGVQYGHFETWRFSGPLAHSQCGHAQDRELDINQFPQLALEADPPVKMLWIASRNPFQQDANHAEWQRLSETLELIVVSDLFHTRSSAAADLFLPVTTHYEHWDLHASYWHYYIGINEPAIEPVGEARSDLQITWDLSKRLNQSSPGSSAFPTEGSEKEWVLGAIGPEMLEILGIHSAEDLLKGPRRVNYSGTAWQERKFQTPSGKYEFYSEKAQEWGLPPLPIYRPSRKPPAETPLRLLTPHHLSGLNSQVYLYSEESSGGAESLRENNTFPKARLNPKTAETYGLHRGDKAILWNRGGSLPVTIEPDPSIGTEVIVIYQENRANLKSPHLNLLNLGELTDMGKYATGAYGLALNETFVGIRKTTS